MTAIQIVRRRIPVAPHSRRLRSAWWPLLAVVAGIMAGDGRVDQLGAVGRSDHSAGAGAEGAACRDDRRSGDRGPRDRRSRRA